MKYAIINGNAILANIIVAEPDFIESIRSEWAEIIELTDHPAANIGDTWDGTSFSKPAPDLEALATSVRQQRNTLLAESDWTQLADSPLDADGKLAWALYRESLRMIPQQEGFPEAVNWPPKPQ